MTTRTTQPVNTDGTSPAQQLRQRSFALLQRWRIPIIVALYIAFVIFFVTVRDTALQENAGAFLVLPVIFISVMYGVRGGIVAGLFAYPLTLLLRLSLGFPFLEALLRPDAFFGMAILVLMGVVIGRLRDLQLQRDESIRQLNETAADLQAVFRAAPDTLLRLAADGRIIDCNAGQSLIFFPDAAQVIGKLYGDVLPADVANIVGDVQQVLATSDEFVRREFQLVRGQQAIWVEVRAFPLIKQQIMFMLRDITERKETEAQRLELATQRERLDSLREFISSISHDFKNPLSIIKANAYLIGRLQDPYRRQEKLKQVKEQAEHLDKMVQDVLIVSRLDRGLDDSQARINLNEMLGGLVRQLQPIAHDKQLTLTLRPSERAASVIGSPNSLSIVFQRLIENALQYSEPGDSITLHTEVENTRVCVRVQDTGVGINEDDLPHIFERFYRADKARSLRSGGAGLGLSIAQKIVEIHGGSIEAESTLGNGTTMCVILPRWN